MCSGQCLEYGKSSTYNCRYGAATDYDHNYHCCYYGYYSFPLTPPLFLCSEPQGISLFYLHLWTNWVPSPIKNIYWWRDLGFFFSLFMLSKNFFFVHCLSPFIHSLVLAWFLDFEIEKHKMRERQKTGSGKERTQGEKRWEPGSLNERYD